GAGGGGGLGGVGGGGGGGGLGGREGPPSEFQGCGTMAGVDDGEAVLFGCADMPCLQNSPCVHRQPKPGGIQEIDCCAGPGPSGLRGLSVHLERGAFIVAAAWMH